MKNTLVTVLVILAVAVLLGAGYWYWQNQKQLEEDHQAEAATEASLGSELYESAKNPVKDKLPETNPFEGAKINPFAE